MSFSSRIRVAVCRGALLLAPFFTIAAYGEDFVAMPKVAPAEAGFEAEGLERAVELYRAAVEKGELRGAVLLVAREGKIALHEAIGWRDKEKGLPMELDTFFRMASNTKAVVCSAALILAEEGKLSLQDPVAKYIPEFAEGDFAKVTVEQLMTHSSGFPNGPILPKDWSADSNLVEVSAHFAKTLKLESEPGTTYRYSNSAYNVLGGVIEAVSGQRLDHFIRERIYEPLGMKESNHHESVADHERMAKVYRFRNGEWRVDWAPGDEPSYPIIRASGGMISTAEEFAVFVQMWLNGGEFGGVRVLSEESVAAGISVKSATESYGYGWQVDARGFFAHGGSDGTYAWADPARNLIGLILTQSPGGKNPRDEFRDLVNAALKNGGTGIAAE